MVKAAFGKVAEVTPSGGIERVETLKERKCQEGIGPRRKSAVTDHRGDQIPEVDRIASMCCVAERQEGRKPVTVDDPRWGKPLEVAESQGRYRAEYLERAKEE